MTNAQLLEAVIARAQAEASGAKRSADNVYDTLEIAFCSAIRDSLRETKSAPEPDPEFLERVVGNFIIESSNDGFTAEEIRNFLHSLAPNKTG